MKGKCLFVALALFVFLPLDASARQRIVGGEDTRVDWPWMAALVDRYATNPYHGHFCGGVLIHPEWVVTAAHCVEFETTFRFEVIIGRRNLQHENGERLAVQRIVMHPDYHPTTSESDLALLQLAQPSTQVWLPLPDEFLPLLAGTPGTILGWGKTDPMQVDSPETLQQAEVPLVDRATCNLPISYNGAISANMLCAGYEQGGVDACGGDSGGPLVVKDGDGRWTLAGISSFGEGCGKPRMYGVYTQVQRLLPFIREHLCDSAPSPPRPSLDWQSNQATLSWFPGENEETFRLYAVPLAETLTQALSHPVAYFDLQQATRFSARLVPGDGYFTALRAFRDNCPSEFSPVLSVIPH